MNKHSNEYEIEVTITERLTVTVDAFSPKEALEQAREGNWIASGDPDPVRIIKTQSGARKISIYEDRS